MIVEISILIASLAFAALVIYLIVTLLSVKKMVDHLNRTLTPISEESKRLLRTTNIIAENALEKAEALDPLFNSISNLSEYAEHATHALKPKARKTIERKEHYSNGEEAESTVKDVADAITLGLGLWQKFKNRR